MDTLEEICLERDEAISRKLAAEELRLAEVRQNKSARLLDLEALENKHKEEMETERRKRLDKAARYKKCVSAMKDERQAAYERYRSTAQHLALATESKHQIEKARDQQKADKLLAKSEQW